MKLIERGKADGKTILMVDGMVVDYAKGFRQLGPLLEADYLVLYLQQDGYRGVGEFDSIPSQAGKAVDIIVRDYGGHLDYAYGISMGANIIIDMLGQKPDLFTKVYLDAPFLVRFPKLFLDLVAGPLTRKLKRAIDQGDYRAYNKKLNASVDFDHEEIDARDFVDEGLSWVSIKNQALSSYRMTLSDQLKQVDAEVRVVCGSKEKWALRSYRLLEKYLQKLDLLTFPGHNHATKIKFDVEEYRDAMVDFFEGQHNG